MNNVKEPEIWFKGPTQTAWSYVALGKQAHVLPRFTMSNIPRPAVFANGPS